MQTRILVTIAVQALLMGLFTSCAREAEEVDEAGGEREILNLVDAAWDALSVQDLELFQQYITPDWQLYTARGNKMDAETLFNIHRENITEFELEHSNMDVRIQGSLAWATYDAALSGLMQGEDWGGQFIFTNIFVRENGEWQIMHMHESMQDR